MWRLTTKADRGLLKNQPSRPDGLSNAPGNTAEHYKLNRLPIVKLLVFRLLFVTIFRFKHLIH